MPSTTIEAVEHALVELFPGHKLVRRIDPMTKDQVIELYDPNLRNRPGIIRVTFEFSRDVMPEQVPARVRAAGVPAALQAHGEVTLKAHG